MSKQLNLDKGKRAERKTLITVAEWTEYSLLASEPADWHVPMNLSRRCPINIIHI